MPGQLRISAPVVVTRDHPFDCTVHIANAVAGDIVTVRLWQTAGVAPLYSGTADAPISGTGHGVAIFRDVTLAGPCHARLVADDEASATPLSADDLHLEVVA